MLSSKWRRGLIYQQPIILGLLISAHYYTGSHQKCNYLHFSTAISLQSQGNNLIWRLGQPSSFSPCQSFWNILTQEISPWGETVAGFTEGKKKTAVPATSFKRNNRTNMFQLRPGLHQSSSLRKTFTGGLLRARVFTVALVSQGQCLVKPPSLSAGLNYHCEIWDL